MWGEGMWRVGMWLTHVYADRLVGNPKGVDSRCDVDGERGDGCVDAIWACDRGAPSIEEEEGCCACISIEGGELDWRDATTRDGEGGGEQTLWRCPTLW